MIHQVPGKLKQEQSVLRYVIVHFQHTNVEDYIQNTSREN